MTKQLSEGFKRSVYWTSYQINPTKVTEKGKNLYKLLNASFQGVRRLFVLAYVVVAGAADDETGIKNNKKGLSSKRGDYYLQRINRWRKLLQSTN